MADWVKACILLPFRALDPSSTANLAVRGLNIQWPCSVYGCQDVGRLGKQKKDPTTVSVH